MDFFGNTLGLGPLMSLAPLGGTLFRRPLGLGLVRGNVRKNLKLGHPLHLTAVDLIAKPPYDLENVLRLVIVARVL